MKLMIILVIAFLILVYVYAYIKHKKRKSKTINSVNEFHKKFLSVPKNTSHTKYVTKHNSTLDYIEKDKFLNG